ncbi:hypothetical protein MVEG_00807 [Podila verticillata NRRL 6337]|nr:hypothetical protein MVEG_00807 [Podila verticillata NRRL 6337]
MSTSSFSDASTGTPGFSVPKRVRREQLLARNKPVKLLGKWRTTNQLEPATFCDYIGQVCYFQHEMMQTGSESTTLLMTDYTEHESLPFSDKDNRPIGKASLVVTLWDEHARMSVQMGVAPGQYLMLKNLVSKKDANGVIQLSMHGYRPHHRAYRVPDPITILNAQDSLVQPLRLRRNRYELDLAALNQEPSPEPEDSIDVKREPSIAPFAIPAPEASSTSHLTSMASITFASSVKREQSVVPQATHVANILSQSYNEPAIASTSMQMEASTSSTLGTSATCDDPKESNLALNIQGGSSMTANEQPPEPAPNATSRTSPTSQDSPTEVLVDRLRQEQRNSRKRKPYELQFLRMKAKVAGFSPTDINHFSVPECANSNCNYQYDPASAGNLPTTCPQCEAANRVRYVHRFTLNLMDEFDQGLMVSVDDKDAKTLLGPGYDAMNMSKDGPRKEKLLERLSQIGVCPGKHDSATSKLLDCCIRIFKTSDCVEHKEEGHGIPPYQRQQQRQQQDESEPSAGKKRKVSESSNPNNKTNCEPISSEPQKIKQPDAQGSKGARSTVPSRSGGLHADYQASLVYTAIK